MLEPLLVSAPPVRRFPHRLLGLMLAVSLSLHLMIGWVGSVVLEAPSLDIEFEVPVDVELGLSEEVAAAAPQPPAPPPPPEPPAPGDKPSKKRHPVEDAGPEPAADAGTPADGGPEQPGDGGAPAKDLIADGKAEPGARLPPGAQIAVRVDMARIRASAVADDVRQLLAAVPDWQALLEGSGIDPVTQLDRLLIATPNLDRSKVVIAGRFIGDESLIDDAKNRMAAAHGGSAGWFKPVYRNGVRVGPWPNADETPRVIAQVGPSHFTISRLEDLDRVLAIASARAIQQADGGAPTVHPADALLSMEQDEGLSLEVDGVERFVRKAKHGVPVKLRLSAVEVPGPRVELRGRLVFADAAIATEAQAYWSTVRDRYARNGLVVLLGLSEPLRTGTLEVVGSELRVKVELSVEQTRLILGYVRELISKPPPPPDVAPTAPVPGK